MIIVEVCNYSPDYAGNFIASLQSLEHYALSKDKVCQIIYVFPKAAIGKKWIRSISDSHRVIFLSDSRIRGNLELLKLCRECNVDILHTHFYGLLTGCLVGWFSKTKVVHHFHNTWEQKSHLKNIFLRYVSSSVNKLVGCSKAVYDTLLAAGFPEEKSIYITNCIDFKRLDIVKDNNPYCNDKRNLLILGTDFYRKGVDHALRAIEPLSKKYDLQLSIITHDTEETTRLVEKTLQYVPEWVTVMNPVDNIGDYYRGCEVFLSPSLAEGLCYAVPEALHCGCMVLKNDIPSLTYNIEGESYITIIGSLQTQIEQVLNTNVDVLQDKLERIRIQIDSKFNVNQWSREVYKLYNSI